MRFPRYVLPLSLIGTAVGSYVLFRDKMGGKQYQGEERVTGETIVVTGANTGLGRELASEMASRGGRVIMACRDMDKCEETRLKIIEDTYNKNVHCKPLDLASMQSIRKFADDFKKTEKRLDILINNAGLMSPEKQNTEDGFELHLGVNYLGPFLLTNLLLDKLKQSQPSRIINMVSITYQYGRLNFKDLNRSKNYYKGKDAYCDSKLALVMFTRSLSEKLQDTDVTTYAVHPGICRTDIGRRNRMEKSKVSSTILGPLWHILFKTPRDGIQTALYCALNPDLAAESGYVYEECTRRDLIERALDEGSRKRLWAISESWTQLEK